MTEEKARYMRDILDAYLSGKKIQIKIAHSDEWTDLKKDDDIIFNSDMWTYRVKPGQETLCQRGDVNYKNPYKIKRTGEAQDMILTLCDTYSFAAIGRVFGYSRERVRQIYEEKRGKI